MNRDRDPAGRPRNARPRDGLGRPLARPQAGTPQAGQDGRDDRDDRVGLPDDLVITGPDAARRADQLLRAGRPFHAHEVLEAAWKSGPPGERDLWQGLAQVAVGLTHAHRGNARGAVTLLRRGADRVRAYCDRMAPPDGRGHPYGIDTAAVLAACDELAARIEVRGLAGMTGEDLRPPLLAAGPAAGR
ncbi:MAG: DUF309 domain-containing protein [Streptosporangiaceae bacterium]